MPHSICFDVTKRKREIAEPPLATPAAVHRIEWLGGRIDAVL
jgi:hypothetical protein